MIWAEVEVSCTQKISSCRDFTILRRNSVLIDGMKASSSLSSKPLAVLIVAVLVTALAMVSVVFDQRPAHAAGALYCGDIFAQEGLGDRKIWQVDRDTGEQTTVGTFSIPGATGSLNGTGIYDADGDG